jgi:universal stress protein E
MLPFGGAMELKRILVAIKPWQRGLPLAAHHARQLAQQADAELQLVASVFDAAIGAGLDRREAMSTRAQERALAAAQVELERLASSMRNWGARVTTRAVWGVPPYETILAAAREWSADLVVVGAHARLTDTDWQLMRRARCPLLLVKSAAFNGYRTILAAVDPLHAHDEPDGLDRAVLAASRSVARAFGSTVRALFAYPGPSAFELASAVEVAPGVYYGTENVEALHRRAVEELVAEYGIEAQAVDLVEGTATVAIVDGAARRRADLVVVGTQQRRGMAAAMVSNTAELVAGELACDVLVVPSGVHG